MLYPILMIPELRSFKHSLIGYIGSICIHKMKYMHYLFEREMVNRQFLF